MILVCCGLVGILSRDVHFHKLMGRNLKEKWKMQKWQALIDKTYLRIWRKVEISIATYDVWWVWNGTPYYGKGEEIISDFDSRNSKILSVSSGFLKKFVRQRIEHSKARVWLRDKLKDLEFPGWWAFNPKFSPQKLKNWLTSPNNNFPNPVFFS